MCVYVCHDLVMSFRFTIINNRRDEGGRENFTGRSEISIHPRLINSLRTNVLLFFYFFLVVPVVTLKMGTSLNPKNIKEGDDVYFECNVRANPRAYRLTWFHEVLFFPSPHFTRVFLSSRKKIKNYENTRERERKGENESGRSVVAYACTVER